MQGSANNHMSGIIKSIPATPVAPALTLPAATENTKQPAKDNDGTICEQCEDYMFLSKEDRWTIVVKRGGEELKMGNFPIILPETNVVGNFFRSFFQNDGARLREWNDGCALCEECRPKAAALFPQHYERALSRGDIATKVIPGFKLAFKGAFVFADIVKGFGRAFDFSEQSLSRKGFDLALEGTRNQLWYVPSEKAVALAQLYNKYFQAAPPEAEGSLRGMFRVADFFAFGYCDTWSAEDILAHLAEGLARSLWSPLHTVASSIAAETYLSLRGPELAAEIVALGLPIDMHEARYAARFVVGKAHLKATEGRMLVANIAHGIVLAGEGVLSEVGHRVHDTTVVGRVVVDEAVLPAAQLTSAAVVGILGTPLVIMMKGVGAAAESRPDNNPVRSFTRGAIRAWASIFK